MTSNPLLSEELAKLPAEWRQKIELADVSGAVEAVATKFNLSTDQKESLELETMLVAVGLEDEADFSDNVFKSLGSEESIAVEINKEISDRVFSQLREYLSKIKTEGETEERVWNEKFKSLPPSVQQAILSSDTEEKITAIGTKYQLHVDQTGVLAEETEAVMLGNTPSDQFVSRLKSKLGIDEFKAKNIAEEVNREVLQDIREAIKQRVDAPAPSENIMEKKLSGVMNLSTKPWEQDPYLEKP